MATLDRALQIAVNVHKGQKDKFGEPYILHPLRLMQRMATIDEKIIAVLHDVIEDSSLTTNDLLKEGFNDTIVHVVDLLSKREGEKYDHYISRLQSDAIARKIKLADLEDNMDLTRIHQMGEEDRRRLSRYHKAWLTLKAKET
ncbi:MAG: HD domain-containing protein [Caldithrix sp.]|nr:HD domain-containing protein [Caldithrix sp.]